MTDHRIITHGSLFAGINGFGLGFSWVGIKTLWTVELDSYCRKVIAKNTPDVKIYEDIHDVGSHNLESVDIISGGFPCQDISVAGKQAGITGRRSGLWGEMFRIIGELRPRYAVIENVANLVRLGLETVICNLACIGYDAEWQIISAADVGAPHLRKRVWIISYPQGNGCGQVQRECTEKLLPKNEDAQKFEGSCRNVPDTNQFDDDNPGYETGKVRGERQEKTEIQRHFSDSTSQRLPDWAGEKMEQPYPITEFERPCGREIERDFRGMAYGVSYRVDRLRALGNAVVPQIPEIIGRLILECENDRP